VDTNNITESFNNVLRQRYLPLRHDTTIFALVQILIEVAFPEQETKYTLSILNQTQSYRKPRYQVPSFLEDRPHQVQSLCMLNIERARSIPKSHLHEIDEGTFQTMSRDDKSWKICVSSGTCTCPAFVTTNIPCKHFFAVFYHFPTWSWNDLPKSLTESIHMTLDDISVPSVDIGTQLQDVVPLPL